MPSPPDQVIACIAGRVPSAPGETAHPLWQEEAPPTLVIDEVERVWAAIAEKDDWQPLVDKVAAIRRLGEALGEAPMPAGHK